MLLLFLVGDADDNKVICIDGEILTVILNDPNTDNALGVDMLEELNDIFTSSEKPILLKATGKTSVSEQKCLKWKTSCGAWYSLGSSTVQCCRTDFQSWSFAMEALTGEA